MRKYEHEKDMYEDIIKSVSSNLDFLGFKYKVFRTWKEFSPDLKILYPNVISILGKEVLPDILVSYYNSKNEMKTIIIEVKLSNLVAKDIGQAKIYGDIYDADIVLLVSQYPLRQSFREFYSYNKKFMLCNNGAQLYTCVLSDCNLQLQNCYPLKGGLFDD